MDKVALPSFGELLNYAIQTIKNLSSRKITPNAFHKEFDKLSGITEKHKQMLFMSDFDIRYGDEGTACIDLFLDVIIECLSASGVIKNNVWNLEPNLNQHFATLISFDEPITQKNLTKIDPQGKIFFWLACNNFINYINADIVIKTHISDLEIFDKQAFSDLKKANIAAYGENGDPLINHLISETARRTSIFMNNYQQEVVGDNTIQATPEMIMTQFSSLTSTQFEWFCIKLVEHSLKNESPESAVHTAHTGKTNDGGLDGYIIQTYPNGEKHHYYIQSKLYTQGNNISNSGLRNFIGAYPPNKKFHHGIFITTSSFTKPAQEYANGLQSHSLILIDQNSLIELMIEHKVGLRQAEVSPKLVMDIEFFKRLEKY